MGNTPTISLTPISLLCAEKCVKKLRQPSGTSNPEKPALEIDIRKSKTSIVDDKVKEGFNIECCNVNFSMMRPS